MKQPKNRGARWQLVFIICIILVGLLPRMIEVLSGNYLFGYDQGLFFERVRHIVSDHKLTLIGEEVGGRGGFFQGPGFYYLLAIPFMLFGGDPYGAMLLMFLTGALTLICAAIFIGRSFSRQEALFVVFLLAVSPAMVAQSRFIWNPFFIPIISLGVLVLFYEVLKKKELALLGLFGGLGLMFHFEIATGIMMFVEFSLFTLYLWIRRLLRGRFVLGAYAVFFLTQIHFVLFDLRHDFLITKGIISTALGKSPHAITWVYLQHMFWNHWDVFRHNFFSTFAHSDNIWPFIVGIVLIGVYGIMKDPAVDKARKRLVMFLCVSPILMFALYMKYTWPMWEWWLLELGVVYVFLIGLVISWGWRRGGIWRVIVASFMMLLFVSHITSTIGFYRSDYGDYGGTHKIRGKKDALDVIYRDAAGQPFNLLVFSPPVYTYPYDYLVWWYGNRTYGYMPGKEKKGTFYLLIEPDASKPWSYKGWLETVIKTGTVIRTWNLPSGFIIEKRIESMK